MSNNKINPGELHRSDKNEILERESRAHRSAHFVESYTAGKNIKKRAAQALSVPGIGHFAHSPLDKQKHQSVSQLTLRRSKL